MIEWNGTQLEYSRTPQLFETQLAYWKQQLNGPLPPLDLPTDYPRPAVQTFEGARSPLTLPPDLTQALKTLSDREGATLFMTLMAAFKVLLYRYTGQEDIPVGSPIANRNRSEFEPLTGFLANTLVFRTDLSGQPSFRELLSRVRKITLEAYAHQDLPFEKLVAELQPKQDLSRSPLFQVMFALQDAPLAPLTAPSEAKAEPMAVDHSASKFDLALILTETGQGLEGYLEYNTELFEPETIRRLAAHYQSLLHSIVSNPDQALSELSLLTEPEQQRLITLWNNTGAGYPRQSCIHQLFEAQVARTPDRVALVYGNQSLTYQALNQRANQVAHLLQTWGVGPEVLVGLHLERSLEMVIGLLGVLKAGGAYVPLDPAFPAQRLQFMANDAGLSVLLTQAAQPQLQLPPEVKCLYLDADGPDIAQQRQDNPISNVTSGHRAYVIYTSGSTGRPKGVQIEHQAVVNFLCSMLKEPGLSEQDSLLAVTTLSFDIAVLELLLPLVTGARAILVSRAVAADGLQLLEYLSTSGATVMQATPATWRLLLEAGWTGSPGLKILCGGEALPRALADQLLARAASVWNMYGPTETTIWSSVKQVAPGEGPLVLGPPIANTQFYVLDQHLQPVPIGVPGELHIGGEGLARGYLNRPELTCERFIPDPFRTQPGSRIYKTGDQVCWLADGTLKYLGRIDHQVKLRGYRIELGEIEVTLSQHPGVQESVVLAQGELAEEKYLAAYIVPGSEQKPTSSELRRFLKGQLPEYMVPAVFIPLESFPLTPNGKIDRQALSRLNAKSLESETIYVDPRTPLEAFLKQMWQEVLGRERIGIHDNFFELGGDSLKGAVFINRLQAKLGEYIYIIALFEAPTIADLADYLNRHYSAAILRMANLKPEQDPQLEQKPSQKIDLIKSLQFRRLINPLAPHVEDEAETTSKNPPAVFILSPPRSGTTLLRVMLGGHPHLFAPPELDLLSFNTLQERKTQLSGPDSFRLEGTIRALMALNGVEAEQAQQLMADYEAQQLTTRQFYRLLQAQLAPRLLVDKTTFYGLDMNILRRAEMDFDSPYYIHLLRHPYGMIHSFEKARADQLYFRGQSSFSAREVAELVWLICHQNILDFLTEVPPHRQYRLKFEDLVNQPEPIIEGLCQFLGLEWHPGMLQPYQDKAKRMTDGLHSAAASRMVGDVKFHEHQAINSSVANQWQNHYTEDFLGDITWQLAELLGYNPPATEEVHPTSSQEAYEANRLHLETSFQIRLPLVRLFESPTAAGQGSHNEAARPTPAGSLSPALQHQGLGLQQIGPQKRDRNIFPLSFAQQRLWFLAQLEPDSFAYNMSLALCLRGALNLPALEKAFNEIVQRHDTLRTTFTIIEAQPVQVISPSKNSPLSLIDLQQLPESERQAHTWDLITKESQQPFDLTQGPLLRMKLLRLDETEHVLLLVMHHIVSDGWSIRILVRELSMLYKAFSAGEPSPLPPLPIQYPDFAAWQRQWFQGEVLQTQLSYWKNQLAGAPPGLDLTLGRARPKVQTYRGAHESITLSKSLSEALKLLSQQEKATLFMTLLAAFKILLYRYTGQVDILVGSPVAGRNWAEVEGLIGFFNNTLVLRTDLSNNPSFRELVKRIRKVALEAYAHQDLPFEKLVEELQPERDLSRTPLFQVFFNMHNFEDYQPDLGGITAEYLSSSQVVSKFDLTLYVREQNGEIYFKSVYNTDLFCQDQIVEMLAQLEHLLWQIVANPDEKVDRYSLITPGAKALLPNPTTSLSHTWKGAIPTQFAYQAQRVPEHPAIVDKQGLWTYKELEERSNQLANYLLTSGIGPQDIIAIYGYRSASLIWALLGILQAGAAFVILDSAYPAARLIHYLQVTKPQGLIQLEAAGPLPEALEKFVGTLSCRLTLPQSKVTPEHDPLSRYSAANPGVTVDPDDLAYVLFTSGTTGRPNAIQGTQRPLTHFLEWHCQTFDLQETDRFSILSGLSHDPLLRDIFTPLWLGATLYIPDPEDDMSSSNRLANWINQAGISVAHLTPPLAQLIASGAPTPENSSLRYLFFGGDILLKHDVAKIRELAPLATCVNFYGATETPQAMGYFVIPDARDGSAADYLKEIIPLGQGIQDVQLLILNRSQQLAGIGELGEIYVRTPYLSKGYLGDSALTESRFIANPFTGLPGDLVYQTGDLGRYLPDGNVEFIGRIDHQVKIRGFRVEPGEIEAVLNQHPAVGEAVVIAREDRPGDKRLVGYVVLKGGQEADLRQFLREKLPDYMVPSAFVLLETLPLTPNGKIDRQALPMPEHRRADLESGFVAPGDEVERRLSQIWEELLGGRPISVQDNFFQLGGHSLLAVHLLTKIEETFGVRLSLITLFQEATIEQLARLIRQQDQPTAWSSAVALQPQGTRPPFFCVHGIMGDILWFTDLASYMAPDQPFYGIQARGLDGIQAPIDQIEATAAYYIEEIRCIQPEGPYYLGGASYGGHVAFEMAQQLLAQGQQVGLLAVFDSLPPNMEPARGHHKLVRQLTRATKFMNNVPHWVKHSLQLDAEEKAAWAQRKVIRLAKKVKMRLNTSDLELKQIKATDIAKYAAGLPEYRHKLIETHFQARRNYKPKVYPGQITLFRAKVRPLFNLNYPELEWRRLAVEGVDIQEIPGSHTGMFKEPYVQLLAQQLKQCIVRRQELFVGAYSTNGKIK